MVSSDFFLIATDGNSQLVPSECIFYTTYIVRLLSPCTLRSIGIREIVVEDLGYGSSALNCLRQELETDNFTLKKRIPIVSSSRMLNGIDLLVYEYKGWKEARPDATVSMDIPLIGENIVVPLKDLA